MPAAGKSASTVNLACQLGHYHTPTPNPRASKRTTEDELTHIHSASGSIFLPTKTMQFRLTVILIQLHCTKRTRPLGEALPPQLELLPYRDKTHHLGANDQVMHSTFLVSKKKKPPTFQQESSRRRPPAGCPEGESWSESYMISTHQNSSQTLSPPWGGKQSLELAA